MRCLRTRNKQNFRIKLQLEMSVVELVPVVQNYAWGISGSSATVADLYHANNGGSPRADQPYAGELGCILLCLML